MQLASGARIIGMGMITFGGGTIITGIRMIGLIGDSNILKMGITKHGWPQEIIGDIG